MENWGKIKAQLRGVDRLQLDDTEGENTEGKMIKVIIYFLKNWI